MVRKMKKYKSGLIEFERKIGPKGELIIPEEFRKRIGIKPKTIVHFGLENHRIYIKPEKEDPVVVFKQIAETEPITKEISIKSREEEIEERWNKTKR